MMFFSRIIRQSIVINQLKLKFVLLLKRFKQEVETNDPAVAYSPNNADAVICIFGAILAGASWVPVNIRNSVKSNIII